MPSNDKRIDAYIAKAQPFAQPLLIHFRNIVHTACPDVQETIKWGFPHFDYKDEMMCSMAAFKQHCAFGFWKASLMKDKSLKAHADSESAMGHFGRVTSFDDLPSDKKLIAYIKEAMKMNDEGIKVEKKPVAKKKKELVIPPYFLAVLQRTKRRLPYLPGSVILIKRSMLNGLPMQRAKKRVKIG